MCGICGVVDLRGSQRADLAFVQKMCDRIRHRGPDGDGFFSAPNAALGMRRLSIIDVAGSDQPLYNEDRSLTLVFNGEIYNYKELRAELIEAGHTLTTEGDGETLLHLYEMHGLDMFSRLRGMYGFALWDAPRQRLVLAVDHIGMKPLYLWERDGQLIFASEVKAFLAHEDAPRALNLDVLDTYLSFGYMIGEQTLFEGVRRLMPGHVLIAENGAIVTREYWRFASGYDQTYAPPSPMISDSVSIIGQARDRLTESVRLHLRSDVPLGLFLSGGVDSAAVLGLMSEQAGERVRTFTVGYDMATPDNELAQARRIAEHYGTQHHEHIIDAQDWWGGFERYIYHHDEPNANSSAVSLLLLAETTAREVKVVLTGLGGDELFGGYPNHRTLPWIIHNQPNGARWLGWSAGLLGAAERYYPHLKRWRYVGALPTYLPRLRHTVLPLEDGLRRSQSFDGFVWSDALREALYGGEIKAAWGKSQHKEKTFAEILARSWQPDPANTAQALVINTWLTGNALLHCDKVTMAHSLEARIPFFDPALLDFAARIPPSIRMTSNKVVLREAVRSFVPAFALERPKQPFSTPILAWFASDLRPRIESVLLDRSAFIRDLFDRDALERLLRNHFAGTAPQVEVVFRLLTLELWAQRFLRAETVAG